MQTFSRIVLVTALSFFSAGSFAQLAIEPIPVLRASEVLPEDLLKGPHHTVREEVRSDGYLNYYIVDSDFGSFEARSNLMLRTRVREFDAMAELERVSKTEVFGKAAIDAGLSPARTVVSFVTNPVDTVTGIPKGIGRMFKRFSRSTTEGAAAAKDKLTADNDDVSCDELENESDKADCEAEAKQRARGQSLHERYFKVSDAERQWHQKLGTDPYTSNDVLYEAVKSVAWADRLGRFAVKFAGIPSIPGANYMAAANTIVWSKDPYELQDYNMKILRDAGVDEATIEAFFDNIWFSPTMQTTLIAALASIPDVTGRSHVLAGAINTESEAAARFVLESLVALTWYNVEKAPLMEFEPDDRFPFATTATGDLVVILPVDHLVWTEGMAALAGSAAAQHRQTLGPGNRELWLLGSVSPAARQGIEQLGWRVSENMAATIRATQAADNKEENTE